ncbi:unnamed protein product [Brassicogethes aeneus]|uniref:Uncharacterized protein n=1 Tax=Brassicogethes aeneus TaxID=1431903 RepID=A0A9P0BL94_BRAAE|nr:unnamed protein product [Brassicogethes aeneus]
MKVLLHLLVLMKISSSCWTFEVAVKWKNKYFKNSSNFKNPPSSFEIDSERIYLAMPQYHYTDQTISLGYIIYNTSTHNQISPEIYPFPNMETHLTNKTIVSATYIQRCVNKLWVLDSGAVNITSNTNKTQLTQPKIIFIDLDSDTVMLNLSIPKQFYSDNSLLVNMAYEESSSIEVGSFIYIADWEMGIIVCSLGRRTDQFWLVKKEDWNPSPQSLTPLNWMNHGTLTLAVKNKYEDNELCFNSLDVVPVYCIKSNALKIMSKSYTGFETLQRFDGKQILSSVFLRKKNLFFFGLVKEKGLGCVNRNVKKDRRHNIVTTNKKTMVHPTDVKIDDAGNLWLLNDRLEGFMSGKFGNVFLLKASVDHIMKPCQKVSETTVKSGCPRTASFPNFVLLSIISTVLCNSLNNFY